MQVGVEWTEGDAEREKNIAQNANPQLTYRVFTEEEWDDTE